MNHQLRSPTHVTYCKSFVKDVIKRLELVTPKSGRADAAGPSHSKASSNHMIKIIIASTPMAGYRCGEMNAEIALLYQHSKSCEGQYCWYMY